ncbi:ATPase [Candidatus Pacearchaeota archaeon CG10_big_fil_rev_8_21_14_0_10_34_76]|nr:MAG: ATPase [Candidatus Pacearchaeota archaeon CG10_big_fil_rev_8_21_14_0_10_34_76]
MTEVKLKVLEALQDDAYKGVARIDTEVMKSLDLKRGDIISIKGDRETVAIVDRSYPADVGEGIIRIDGLIRRNAKTGIGELVTIKKSSVKNAKKISLAPAQQGIVVQGDPEFFRNGLLGRAIVKGDIISLGGAQRRKDLMHDMSDIFGDIEELFGSGFGFSGFQRVRFVVTSASPSQPVIITEETEIVMNAKAVDMAEESFPDVTYEDIGGLKEEIKKVREMAELPLKHPEVFDRLGIEPPKGVLLHGPPGTGKTLLAKAVANESEANFVLLNGPEIMSKFYGESEKKIRDLFEDAEKNAPTIIFIDEIDAIAPKREEVQGEVERRVVSQLLTMMDGLQSRGRVIVIGATNRPNSLDPALRRPGRFDREIEISVPDKAGRLNILKIHTRNMPLDKTVKLEVLAGKTHGFVGADLASLAKEAAMNILRKLLPEMKLEDDKEIPQEMLDKMIISMNDFEEALKVVRPSAMREVLVESPNIKWEEVGGLEVTKQMLKEAVEWPLKHRDSFERMGIKPPRGVLLYGPPGTGKTMLAKAVATEAEANFIQVKGPSLLSMWVGKSEEGVRKVFERARQVAPCIVFFDEIDALAGKRGLEVGTKVTERVLNQLLAEMDGLEGLKDVTVIAATNRPDMLDSALLRPGRFDRIVLVDVPDLESRKKIFEIHTKNMPLDKSVKMDVLIRKTEGFVGADIESFAREAAIHALRKNIKADKVTMEDFEEALVKVKPSVSEETAKRYKKIEEYYLKTAKAGLAPSGPIYTG